MRYISLFSGVEAATLAADSLGWEPVAFCEIDDFPSAVLAARFPSVPNLGDVTKVDWSQYHGAADLVIGGFPCQSYSIAGLRKGLDEPRGQLMLEFLAACRDIDPEWIVAENVPGLLSSGRGGDFKTFLEAVAILWPRGGVAWRILDSQWFGVAQRRRRVFAVINTRDWRRAAEVLLDEHCMRGNTPTRDEARQAAAANAQGRVGESGEQGDLMAFKWFAGAGSRTMPSYDDGSTPTLTVSDAHQPALAVRTANTGANGCGISDDVAHTVDAAGPEAVAFAQNQRDGLSLIVGEGDVASSLNAERWGNHKGETLIAEPMVMASMHANAEICTDGVSPTILSRSYKGGP